MKDSFLWYFIKFNYQKATKNIKYIITDPVFWFGWGCGGSFIMGVYVLCSTLF